MSPEQQDKLFTDFPNLFHKLSHIECGDGWYPILYDLCQQIKNINYEKNIDIVQIKEKFGGLRVYVDAENLSDDEVYDLNSLVSIAESLSFKTCEACASTEGVTTSGHGGWWIKTYCEPCSSIIRTKD